MAEKIGIHYFDDLDGAVLDVEDLQTVEWSWAGVNYHFDTSTINLEKIEAGHISVATLLTKSVRTDKHAGAQAPPDTVASPDLRHSREVRKWAIANHHNGVGKRGRLSKTIVDAYKRAH
ncbi:histone-like nucleoid-structuring protein Lsr2 [Williamsia sp. DF01-3]|uniref:Lsr2 dimerization domain-containing protein n=1 Tax=Williamsia sp. DF01-3 TaxID=2934157 RepID=UPI001FF226CD|nr:histone-like nucleoid-structuring protein Lsr2 [Williamsia sp. DF01-3]MCK0515694.1 Lsr2 family protein [Williamsia sp. DF01-3]